MSHEYCTAALACLLLASAPALAAETAAETEVRALIASTIETTLSSRINADILRLDVRPGDSFRKGDILVAFDCRLPRAQLAKAKAELDSADKTLRARKSLAQYNAVSELEVAVAESQTAMAKADVSLYEAQVSLCDVTAPFDGRVVVLRTAPYAGVSSGAPLLDILDSGGLEVRLHIPSNWLSRLNQGTRFQVHIDENGKVYGAEVQRIGARVDPVSGTIDVIGRILEPDNNLLAGMSGTATFDQP